MGFSDFPNAFPQYLQSLAKNKRILFFIHSKKIRTQAFLFLHVLNQQEVKLNDKAQKVDYSVKIPSPAHKLHIAAIATGEVLQ